MLLLLLLLLLQSISSSPLNVISLLGSGLKVVGICDISGGGVNVVGWG